MGDNREESIHNVIKRAYIRENIIEETIHTEIILITK